MGNMATEVPREKLKELMEKNGDSLLQDRDRCEGLLKDYCGGHRREISALVGALEERVPLELKSSWQTAMTPEAMRARLVQRLEDNRGLAPEIANYAVDTWSYALGVGLGRSSDRVMDVPVSNGVAVGLTAAERAAADRPAGSVPSVVSAGCGQSRHEQSEQGCRRRRRAAGCGRGGVCTSAPSTTYRPAQQQSSGSEWAEWAEPEWAKRADPCAPGAGWTKQGSPCSAGA